MKNKATTDAQVEVWEENLKTEITVLQRQADAFRSADDGLAAYSDPSQLGVMFALRRCEQLKGRLIALWTLLQSHPESTLAALRRGEEFRSMDISFFTEA